MSSVLIMYQNIDSGAKVVTEEVVSCLRQISTKQPLIVYRQNPHQFNGLMSALKNFSWSLIDCVNRINRSPSTVKVIYTPYYLAVVAHFLSRKRRLPIIFHFHGDHAITHINRQVGAFWPIKYWYIWLFGKLIERLQTTALEQASQVIFVAAQAQRDMSNKYHLQLHENKVAIIHNGVATKVYRPPNTLSASHQISKLRTSLGFTKQQKLVLYSGRIDRKKGIHHILTALKQLNTNFHTERAKFGLIIMHPSYRDKDSATYYQQLQAIIHKAALPVKLIAQPPQLQMYYQLADVCLLPSEQEMMPLVMLESLSSGTPFFGTKVGNMPQILEKIDRHLILRSNSTTSIVTALKWWRALSPTIQRKLAQRCNLVAKQYSWKTTAAFVQQTINLQVQ